MSYGAIAVAGIGAIVNISNAAKNRNMAETQYQDAKKIRDKEQAALESQKLQYKNMQFKNPFANMENVYEDLTVNQQQAEFQSQQAAQTRANIMQGLKGAAGASGIGGLAQSLANQGALQTQRISASIGFQESSNQIASAKGAAAIDVAERQGSQWVQQAEMDRQATLLGIQMGQTTGANLAAQQAQTNQMNSAIASQQVASDLFSTTASAFAQNADKMGGQDQNMLTKTNEAGENVPFYSGWGQGLSNFGNQIGQFGQGLGQFGQGFNQLRNQFYPQRYK